MAICDFCRGKNDQCTRKVRKELCIYSAGGINVNVMDLEFLPKDILFNIFSFMGIKDLLVLRRVSKLWKLIAEDGQFWRELNLTCRRLRVSDAVFRLPSSIQKSVRIINLMWSCVDFDSFNSIKEFFPKTEILLMQCCKSETQPAQHDRDMIWEERLTLLKLMDLRNCSETWFHNIDSCNLTLRNMEAMAFTQTMTSNWLSRLSMSPIPKLRVLLIQNNPSLSDALLTAILKNTPQLESLSINGCMYITGSFLRVAMGELTKLTALDLNGTRLDGSKLRQVDWAQSMIKYINLSFCCRVSENDLIEVLPKIKHLRALQASFCGWGRSLSDEVISRLCQLKRDLHIESIDLQSTFRMTANGLTDLCKCCPYLHHMRIGPIIQSDAQLEEVLLNAMNLRSLSIQMGDGTFSACHLFNRIATYCPKMETLFLYNFDFEVRAESLLKPSLDNLFKSCPHMTNLFTGGYSFTEKQAIDKAILEVAASLGRPINCKTAVEVVPQHDLCFDKLLRNTISQRRYNAPELKRSLQSTIHAKAFYKSGIQKLDEYHFFLLRNS